MEARIDPALLWSRATAVGLLGVGLGITGHLMADGLLPGPGVLIGLALLSVLLSVPMLARPASTTRLVLMLIGGQTFVHLVLALTAGHRGDPTPPATSHPAVPRGVPTLPVVDGHRVGSLQDAYQGMIQSPSSTAPVLPVGHLINDMSAHVPMMLAHLAAAGLVGLWLGYGERCLWTLLALTGRRVLTAVWALVPASIAPRPNLLTAHHLDPFRSVSRWRSQPRSRRGPPLPAS